MSEFSDVRPEVLASHGGIYRRVLVDGAMEGHEVGRLALGDALASSGHDPEVYFETKSGNQYAIYQPDREDDPLRFALIGAKNNEVKGRNAKGTYLTDHDTRSGVLEVGRPFHYGTGNTSEVAKITWVQSGKRYFVGKPDAKATESIAREHFGGRTSNVRSAFWGKIGK